MGSTASGHQRGAYLVVEQEGSLRVDLLTGDFTNDLGEALIREVREREAARLVLDCSRIEFVFSLGLGALIRLDRELRMRGGKLRLCALRPDLRELFAITRIDRVVQICETLDEASLGEW